MDMKKNNLKINGEKCKIAGSKVYNRFYLIMNILLQE